MAKQAKDSPRNFVIQWQKADFLDDVIKKTGLTKKQVRSRCYSYRKKGINLKKLNSKAGRGRPSEIDWAQLAELADHILAKKEVSDGQ